MAVLSEHGIRLSSTSPSFLTSHIWPFGAVAELIDNATDPGVTAKQIWIDVVNLGGQLCLTFTDNGSGMTPNKLHKMLSFTEKGPCKGNQQPIGIYGNGFKSGSMRLGRDALIFTKNRGCQSVGMLSQTYLENIKAQAVVVPIVPFNQQTKSLVKTEDSEASLAAILENSIITSLEKIHVHFDSIPSKKGTKILIWNLRRAKDGKPEIDFETDAYLSILYLKPRTRIILRGKKNMAKLVSKRLRYIEHDIYKPQFGSSHERAGVGVIGIIEFDFLKPAHNKQDFEYTKEYRLTIGALGQKLNDFWRELTEKKARERELQTINGDEIEDEAPTWLQCEECLKWRSVDINLYDVVPENWNCKQNPNPHYRSCSAPEEAEDSEELVTPIYQKDHKKKEHPKSRKKANSLKVCGKLETCVLLDEAAQHQILSKRPSEPVQPIDLSGRTPQHAAKKMQCHTEETALEEYQQDTFHPGDVDTNIHTNADVLTQQKLFEREKVIKDKNKEHVHEEKKSYDCSFENEGRDEMKDTNTEQIERQKEKIYTSSYKRKSSSFNDVEKKPCLMEEQWPDNMADGINSDKQTHVAQTLCIKKTKHDRGIEKEKPDDVAQQVLSHPNWIHSLPFTQTLVASLRSKSEGLWSREVPREEGDQLFYQQKLAFLGKEVQRLRHVLGLEITTKPQGTMKTADCSAETQSRKLVTLQASTASREVGCQTAVAESSTSFNSLIQAPGLQDGPMRKMEPQSMISDIKACEDKRLPQESLRGIRSNLLVLLKALLPQPDLGGISLDTAEIDNILEQILEVNSLKL